MKQGGDDLPKLGQAVQVPKPLLQLCNAPLQQCAFSLLLDADVWRGRRLFGWCVRFVWGAQGANVPINRRKLRFAVGKKPQDRLLLACAKVGA